MNIFLMYVFVLLPMAVLDAVWLFSTGAVYKKWLGHLFADTVNFIPAVVFYLIYGLGVVLFVVNPAIKDGTTSLWIFLSGAVFGLVAYATYDLTNHATMRAWPLQVTIIDMIWGALLTGVVSVAAVTLYNYFR